MRHTIAVLAVLSLGAAQDDRAKAVVERPLKAALGPDRYDLAADGLSWHEGLESVVGRGKPVVLMQLLGRLDDVFC
jgi:hypothetical protein